MSEQSVKPDFQEITKILKLFEDEKSKTVGKAILLNAGSDARGREDV